MEVLEFDVEDHAYSVRGERLPGVTSILSTQFPIDVPPDRLEFARNLGKAIHRATELYDLDTLDVSSLDSRVVPYLEAWIAFRKQTDCRIYHVEKQVWHPVLRYAGTIDRIIALAGDTGVLDLKRPRLGPRVGLQLAAYQKAGEDTLGIKLPKRWGLQLCPEKTPPYRLHEYKDRNDWDIFVACLSIQRWKDRHERY